MIPRREAERLYIAIEMDGETLVHATGSGYTDYATLCGLDGDDPDIGMKPAKLPERPRINCEACLATIRHAQNYR